MFNLIEELKWRGMIHDIMPGTEELLLKEMTTAYVGIDPTADSLHIGHLVSIMLLKHLQLAGHKPIALVGGATAMIGDPSGKSEERNLLDEATIRHNESCLKNQLEKFLDFNSGFNSAEIVNNFDWTKEFSFLGFLRDIGKHLTINYMIAKESVQKRMDSGISYTEFSYQLLQAYDFLYLYEHKNCKLQMGGSDQWGNITSGTELIRRKTSADAFALTCPLITKADGGKFGKTESGNVWLDSKRTSPYKFYQFWLNCSDDDAAKYIKIFTLFNKMEIEALIAEHKKMPEQRLLQKELAKDITIRVHSEELLKKAMDASEILFGKATTDTLKSLDEDTFLSVFEGVPVFNISPDILDPGIGIIDLLSDKTGIFQSKSELRRMFKENAIAVNKAKTNDNTFIDKSFLLNNRFILVQKGKKNYYIIKTTK